MNCTACHFCYFKNHVRNRYCTQCGVKLKTEYDCACLYMFNGSKNKNLFKLGKKECTIGRDKTCTIILDNTEASKNHAIVKYSQGYYWIQDMDSTNGVFINGKKIEKRERLYDGYLLKIGTTLFRYEASGIYNLGL